MGETRENLDMVVRAARRARDLVEQILTFSRRSERERRPLDPKPVFEEALKLLRSTLPATIEIRTHIDEAPMQLLADPSQLHQVMMNLCTNAAHAMREAGGGLEVSVERVRGALDGETAGAALKLSVADTGAGMDADTAARIFDPFFTTKERGQGTGLGLAVVHGIITEHGGTIDVASRPGEGATFTAYLPIDAAVADRGRRARSPRRRRAAVAASCSLTTKCLSCAWARRYWVAWDIPWSARRRARKRSMPSARRPPPSIS